MIKALNMDPYLGKTEGEILTVQHFQSTAEDEMLPGNKWSSAGEAIKLQPISNHASTEKVELMERWCVAPPELMTAPLKRKQRPQGHTGRD